MVDNNYPGVDVLVANIDGGRGLGTIGDSRANVVGLNIVNYNDEYDIRATLRTIRQHHQGGGTITLMGIGGEPDTTGRTTEMNYPLIAVWLPGDDQPPPSLVAEKIPDGDEEHIIRDGHLMRLKHGGQFLVKNIEPACNMEFLRVHENTYVLISHRRPSKNSTRAMSVNEQLTEEHTTLFTQRSEDIESVDFNFLLENGEVSTIDVYDMNEGVTGKAREVVVDDDDDEIPGNTEKEKSDHVRNAILVAIEEARGEKAAVRELLEGSGYDQDTLTAMRVYKIYPNNYEGNLNHYFNRFYDKADIVYAGNREPSVRVRNNE